ncbi:MAG TPA: hypothetical protein PK843_14055 [bacterium]|nr:hypothetical protein [bacterium]
MIKISRLILLCVRLLPIFSMAHLIASPAEIPYPKALAEAAVRVNDLRHLLDESLIIGNGDINALVYQEKDGLVMSLTKNDIWDARIDTQLDPPLPTIDLIKKLGASDTAFPLQDNNRGFVLPEGMTWQGPDSYSAAAHPCPRQCARIVWTSRKQPLAAAARGELDLRSANARILPKAGKRPWAEIRCLAQQNVFLVKTKAIPQLQAIVSAGLPAAETGVVDSIHWLHQTIPGDLDWPGMQFAVAARHDEPWCRIAVVTSRESADPLRDAMALVSSILRPQELVNRHEMIWRQFWEQSGIEISDPVLQAAWYRSLYYLRCFSKPGVQSVGLFAGLINDTPAWHGDYHTNYNLQQTFWSALAANHPELAEPYDRLIFDYLPRASWLAEQVYGLDGAYYPHVLYAFEPPNPNTCKSNNGRQYLHHTWGFTLGVNGFSVQPLWWRYKYDPDPKRLQSLVYPAIREVALFYAGFIERCEGTTPIRLGPSVSPEHWGWTRHLECNYNCTFDIALIRYILRAAVEAAGLVGRDEPLVERFKAALQRLPNYPLSIDEPAIVVDVEGAPAITYNIPVPAAPVFPGDEVTWWSEEKQKQLFARTIEQIQWNGNNATIMLAIARARLSIAGTQEWLRNEITARLRSNGTLSLNRLQPPQRFNDFGHYTEQFGVGMAVSELLLQSVDDVIRIFPALAAGTRAGFTNLRSQGGFLISAAGSSEALKSLQVHSLYGGLLRLASPWPRLQMRRDGESTFHPLELNRCGMVEIATQAGEKLLFQGASRQSRSAAKK